MIGSTLITMIICLFIFFLGGRQLNVYTIAITAALCCGYLVGCSIWALKSTIQTETLLFESYGSWLQLAEFHIQWGFFVDALTATMLLLVAFVSFVVQVFAVGYMVDDPSRIRFHSYLLLFTLFMVLLVTGSNAIILFLGWEGVGLCSYLLIGFWSTRIVAVKAALKAVLYNRIGDSWLLFGLAIGVYLTSSTEFTIWATLLPAYTNTQIGMGTYSVAPLDLMCLGLIIAAMGKSAQIGLHAWLADAMEGPTPVSALIHAATMVTAGVYLLIRCSVILESSANGNILLVWVGAFTAIFAATVGCVQYDIKKVVAYSTCSQLGYMVASCGSANYVGALFHLFNHGFFKALLFLSAGLVIHAVGNEQDIRRMGGLARILPLPTLYILFGSGALLGLPFYSGYYSKDLILESLLIHPTGLLFSAYTYLLFAAFCTTFYSLRLLYFVFYIRPQGGRTLYRAVPMSFTISRESLFLYLAPGLLFVPTICSGYVGSDLFAGLGSTGFASFDIVDTDPAAVQSDLEFWVNETSLWYAEGKLHPTIAMGSSFIIFVFLLVLWTSKNNYNLYKLVLIYGGYPIMVFLNLGWGFNHLYNSFIARNFFEYAKHQYTTEKIFFEWYGPAGLATWAYHSAHKLWQSLGYSKIGVVILRINGVFLLLILLFYASI